MRILGLDETTDVIITHIFYSAAAICSLQKYKQDTKETNVCE